jgi:FPC/CPF motif-containing protein YcgG
VDLESVTIGALPSWGPASARQLLGVLESREAPFPCTFAVAAAKKDTLRFGFVEDLDDPSSWSALPEILREYLKVYQELSRETSMVVFFGDSAGERDLAAYREKFWSVLQFLHDGDDQPWPAGTPTDPDHPLWEFSFAGTQIFVVCNNPAHVRRGSRHSPQFMITFQPRWVFEGLEPESPRGAAARKVIRKRLRAFDAEAPSPELGGFGSLENREWRQYFLTDTNAETQSGCPFHSQVSADPDRLVLLINGLPLAGSSVARRVRELRNRCLNKGIPVVRTDEGGADDIVLVDASGFRRLRQILADYGRDQVAVVGVRDDLPVDCGPGIRTFLISDASALSGTYSKTTTTAEFLAELDRNDGACSR